MRFADLKKRLGVSVVAVGLLSVILLFSDFILVRFSVLALLAFLSAVAIYEFSQLSSKKGVSLSQKILMVLAALLTISFSLPLRSAPLLVGALFFFFLVCIQLRQIKNSLATLSSGCFSLLYIAFPLGLFYRILYPVGGVGALAHGAFWLFYLLAVTKVTDIAAYFGGKCFGKHKLAPRVSPGKTIEGTCIGVAVAIGVSCLFSLYADAFPAVSAIVLGLFIGVIGQIGDLVESLFKRDAKVKDSNTLPGFGGILDMVDSLLLTAPLFYCTMGYLPS